MAAQLQPSVGPGNILVCGTLLGTQAFVDAHLRQRSQHTVGFIDKLVGLPLSAQTKWAVLFHCLQNQEAYLLSSTPRSALRDHLPAIQDATLRGLCSIMGVTDLTQYRPSRPHRHGAWGSGTTSTAKTSRMWHACHL